MEEFEIERPYVTADGVGVLMMQGVVGEVTGIDTRRLHKIEQWAAERGITRIALRMNSEGGDPLEAMAMCDLIRQSGVSYECEVYGLCASAATLIALACKKVRMSASSQFMVHHPFGFIAGELEDLEEGVERFRKVREQAFSLYAEKTGKAVEQLMADHAHAKWYTAQEALEYGFIDEIIEPERAETEAEGDQLKPEPGEVIEEEKVVIEQRFQSRGLMSAATFQRIASACGFKLGKTPEEKELEGLKRQLGQQRETITRLQAERDGAQAAEKKAAQEARDMSQRMEAEVAARVAKREAEIRAEMGVLPGDLPKPETLKTPEKINFKGKTLGEMMRMAHDAQ